MKKSLKVFSCAILCTIFYLMGSFQALAVIPTFAERQICRFALEFNSIYEYPVTSFHRQSDLRNWKLRVMTYIRLLEEYTKNKIVKTEHCSVEEAREKASEISLEVLLQMQNLTEKPDFFTEIFRIEADYPDKHEINSGQLPRFARLQLAEFVNEYNTLTDRALTSDWENRVLGYTKLLNSPHSLNFGALFFIELFIQTNNRCENEFLRTLEIERGNIFIESSTKLGSLVFEFLTNGNRIVRLEICG